MPAIILLMSNAPTTITIRSCDIVTARTIGGNYLAVSGQWAGMLRGNYRRLRKYYGVSARAARTATWDVLFVSHLSTLTFVLPVEELADRHEEN